MVLRSIILTFDGTSASDVSKKMADKRHRFHHNFGSFKSRTRPLENTFTTVQSRVQHLLFSNLHSKLTGLFPTNSQSGSFALSRCFGRRDKEGTHDSREPFVWS
ncbi:unnamed protein product [Amoebophrya sp. A120]|nr:unnamed protein product [Amoebophrya sp. A120]|eukprot:GSA120T00016277001.1